MASTRIWSWIAYRGATPALLGDYLLSRRQFQASLRRERLRADRNVAQFSLVTLSLGRRNGDLKAFSVIADVLESRIRGTDEAGWFAKRTIGIILPDTHVAGAWKLVDDLRSLLAKRGISPQFSVYAYPSPDSGDTEVMEERRVTPQRIPHHRVPAAQPLEVLFLQKLPMWKRAIDVTGAGLGLLLVSPVMLLAALAVKLTSPGPIFYKQRRDGMGGRHFYIYKFRSMVVNADAIKAQLKAQSVQDGPAFKLKNDPRVTPIGRILRRTCIDELPQLWNVLKGDMSIVGPRPMCSKEAQQCARWERRRLDITPGLTCTWQVYGGAKVTFSEWMRMDLRYVGKRSLVHDLRLMVMTVPSVILRDGVY